MRRSLVRRTAVLQVAALILASVAVFSQPQLWLLDVYEGNVLVHVQFAQQIQETGNLYPGHFLYHVFVVATHSLLPISWVQAHFIVIQVVQAGLSVLLWLLIRQ